VLEFGLASLTQAGEDADATRASRIGKLMTAAAASDEVSFITGHILNVDGGKSAN